MKEYDEYAYDELVILCKDAEKEINHLRAQIAVYELALAQYKDILNNANKN